MPGLRKASSASKSAKPGSMEANVRRSEASFRGDEKLTITAG